ncbi:unnamed protein product [Tilletia controversa]|uniref:Uncharacterized protein n=1 Tax=Tilletia controversa TaxID=13291 RepID=A0A8X7N0H9_9BASI|nr:hypothetical protein CF328_g2632 [Tilletia controversa]KAE8254368.1 hypothetical protein A4X06_0g925 [Tilletia controversa]CAD6928974.1 unnamed protein product [Tilletia controversa]CAD6935507.1 unnamed protein product [Tilletia controversa]CAD6946797.1 unnamed protein product [Tilletia controversa]
MTGPKDIFATCRSSSNFPPVAETLLTSCHLVIQPSPPPSTSFTQSLPPARRFVLSDIEFYHFHPSSHPDPFAHAHESQVQSGTWYFHAAGSGAGFKEGSYKGLDVTFGSPDSRSGILIRRIAKIRHQHEDGRLAIDTAVDGPSLVCDVVLGALGFSKVRDLVAWLRAHPSGCGLDALHPASPLRLEFVMPAASSSSHVRISPTSSIPLELGRIWACPRHGLSLKKAKDRHSEKLRLRLDYVAKPYRFLSARPKNGFINLVYAVLLNQIGAGKVVNGQSRPVTNTASLVKHAPAIVERICASTPASDSSSRPVLATDSRNRTTTTRTVTNFLYHINSGAHRHPSVFAGSAVPTTREIGELYGSLIDWDGQLNAIGSSSTAGGGGGKVQAGRDDAARTEPPATSSGKQRKRKLEEESETATTLSFSVHDEPSAGLLSARGLRALRRS